MARLHPFHIVQTHPFLLSAACDPGTRGCGQHGQAVNHSLVPRPSPSSTSSAPCALRVIIKCGGGKTEASASVFPPPHLIITRNAHGAEEGEGARPGNEASKSSVRSSCQGTIIASVKGQNSMSGQEYLDRGRRWQYAVYVSDHPLIKTTPRAKFYVPRPLLAHYPSRGKQLCAYYVCIIIPAGIATPTASFHMHVYNKSLDRWLLYLTQVCAFSSTSLLFVGYPSSRERSLI